MYNLLEKQVAEFSDKSDSERADLWVRAYLDHLDEHGGFILMWGQAGMDDPELRRAGMKAKVRNARRVADLLGLTDEPEGNSAMVALAFAVMVDRFWYYLEVAGLPSTREAAVRTLSGIIQARLVTDL
jgi:hypothetical protein